MRCTATVPPGAKVTLWGDPGIYLGKDRSGAHVVKVNRTGLVHLSEGQFEHSVSRGELEVS